jgi:2-iminobutanoate/2-iminopropanoate deaminase
MRQIISTKKGPNAIGPYSQAVRGGQFIFVSGQISLEPATQKIIDGDIRQQTERVLQNIAGILEAGGSSMNKVVRCVVYLKNMSDFEAMNKVYGKIFAAPLPARTTIEVARLPKNRLVMIEATALVKRNRIAAR